MTHFCSPASLSWLFQGKDRCLIYQPLPFLQVYILLHLQLLLLLYHETESSFYLKKFITISQSCKGWWLRRIFCFLWYCLKHVPSQMSPAAVLGGWYSYIKILCSSNVQLVYSHIYDFDSGVLSSSCNTCAVVSSACITSCSRRCTWSLSYTGYIYSYAHILNQLANVSRFSLTPSCSQSFS